MDKKYGTCPKCGGASFTSDEFRASGSGLAAFMDINDKRLSTVTCGRCSYTELYAVAPSELPETLERIARMQAERLPES